VLGDDLEDRVDVQQLKVLQDLDDGFAAPGNFLNDFLQLQIVDQIALLNERQERVGNVI
jgi:hypothetical protein